MPSFKCLVEYENLADFPFDADAAQEFEIIQEEFGYQGVSYLQEYLHEEGKYFALTESTINNFIRFEAYSLLAERPCE